MTDSYIYIITALLPLAACMVVFQSNPYNALVIRGILGAVAAMLYAILGAADVALTEALVGTMLAITLYAVAVRSSLVMRLGVIQDDNSSGEEGDRNFKQLIADFRRIFNKHHLRVELVPYPNTQALERALMEKEIHATCIPQADESQSYHTAVRVKRIYEIMQTELKSPATILTLISTLDSTEIASPATILTYANTSDSGEGEQ